MDRFKDRVVVITGGTRGIGFSIAKAFIDEGATVSICGRNSKSVEKAGKELRSSKSPNVFSLTVDINNVREIEKYFKKIYMELGGVDILVNNAGVQEQKPSLEVTENLWNKILGTNLKGAFFCSQSAARQMIKKGGGVIISLGSVQSVYVADGQVPYAASKAAMVQLTRSLGKEWAKDGIRVNCVAPGSIPTDINQEYYSHPKNLEKSLNQIPLGRQGMPEEIANVVLFLASSDASYITGVTIYVDGGWLL